MMIPGTKISDSIDALVSKAMTSGAKEAEVICVQSCGTSVDTRLTKKENFTSSSSLSIGLRVFANGACASVSANSFDEATKLIDNALEIAKATPKDTFGGLENSPSENLKRITKQDYITPAIDDLFTIAQKAEESALSVDGIANSEGANASWFVKEFYLANSVGACGSYSSQLFSLSVAPIAKDDNSMEYAFDFTNGTDISGLLPPEVVGKSAAERAISKLKSRKIKSARLPVIFDRRVASGLLSDFLKAINGLSVAYRTSFLADCLDKPIMPQGVDVVDDPFIIGGLRSYPFDADGIVPQKLNLVENGILKHWLTDTYSARKLGKNIESNGHANRIPGKVLGPSPSNVYISPGKISKQDMTRSLKEGVCITEILGFGVNPITGNYSCGACGFKIENGEISYPISEITVAGDVLKMFSTMRVANDLNYETGIDSPSLLFTDMTVSGK